MSRHAFIVIFFIGFLDALGVALVLPLFSPMLFDYRWHLVGPETSQSLRGIWLGVLLSAMPLVQMAVSPFIGALSDRVGRRPLILCTLFFGVFGYLLAAWSVHQQSLLLLLSSRAILGVAAANYSVANACIGDVSDTNKNAFAFMSMAYGAGFAVGPIMGGILAGETFLWTENFSRPFIVAGVLSMLNFWLVFLALPETLPHQGRQSQSVRDAFQGILVLDVGLIKLLIATFAFCFGWAFYAELIPVWWVTQFQMSAADIGFFIAYGAVWYVLICWFFVRPIILRANLLLVFEIAAFSLVASLWCLFIINSKNVFWCIIPFQQLTMAFLFPIAATVIMQRAPKDQVGRVMGLHASAETLGVGISPLLSGAFLGVHLLMPAAIGGCAAIVAALCVRSARRRDFLEARVEEEQDFS